MPTGTPKVPTKPTRTEAAATEAVREVTDLRLEYKRLQARLWEDKIGIDRLLDRLAERMSSLESTVGGILNRVTELERLYSMNNVGRPMTASPPREPGHFTEEIIKSQRQWK